MVLLLLPGSLLPTTGQPQHASNGACRARTSVLQLPPRGARRDLRPDFCRVDAKTANQDPEMERGILSSVVSPYRLLLAWGSLTTVFFLAGKAGNAPCTVTPKCRMWGLHQGSPVGPKALWTVCLVSYPLNTPL